MRHFPLRSAIAILFLCAAALAQNPTASVTVDAGAGRHSIDPGIYGIAYGTTQQLTDLNVPLNRYGGNNASRYNWQLNADNRGQDWYFESIPDASSLAGERGDTFISTTQSGGARPMITIPMLDWVGKLGANRSKLASFSQAKYGAQTGNDWQWFPDAGNGILKSTNQPVQNNDPNDANVGNNSNLQQQWVQAIVNHWGAASNLAPRYYILDNEHSIWHSTHRDVHPVGATMDEIRNRILDYAAQIRAADPNAKIVGPEEWGWSGYFYSGYDQQYGSQNGWSFLPDRANHGGADYLPWLLNQIKLDGRHLLDIFTVHYYPQGGEFSNDTSTTMQLLRNRSTRSLWDPNYTDPTWINDKVMLIPRLRNWVNTYYEPETPIGITEYNWGAESHINGATTQADILGIFGRESLDLAARWTTPDSTTPTYKAIKMYRNYDGNRSTFGDVSVSAAVLNPDNVAAFAARRTSDGALTVMVISKYLSGTTPVSIFSASGTAQVYQIDRSKSDQPAFGFELHFDREPDLAPAKYYPVRDPHRDTEYAACRDGSRKSALRHRPLDGQLQFRWFVRSGWVRRRLLLELRRRQPIEYSRCAFARLLQCGKFYGRPHRYRQSRRDEHSTGGGYRKPGS